MWEESPIGDWTLEIINDGRTVVTLKKWYISFYGTKENPQPGLGNPHQIAPTPEMDLNQVPKIPESQSAPVSNFEKSEEKLSYHLDHCLDSTSPEWCSVCEAEYLLLNGRCVESCPSEGYYNGQEHHQDTCIQCYYSCKGCNGPNDYQVS